MDVLCDMSLRRGKCNQAIEYIPTCRDEIKVLGEKIAKESERRKNTKIRNTHLTSI